MARVLCLFSGGLDSILAVKLLQQQNIDVVGLTFVSYFFGADGPKKMADNISLPLKIIDISTEHLAMVKNPQYGYGKNMNPCLDCHLMMLTKAREIMENERFDCVATGEVLGERPFSQNQAALNLLEQKSRLISCLLRPLSAKLLPLTIAEQRGLIDRNKLMDISGRSRKKQIALAKEFNLTQYPTPAGGCLLTDPSFGQRLKEMLKRWPEATGQDIELLKCGRIFWHNDILLVVGRDKAENEKLEKLAIKGDLLIEIKDIPGPLLLVRGAKDINWPVDLKIIFQNLLIKYSPRARAKMGIINFNIR